MIFLQALIVVVGIALAILAARRFVLAMLGAQRPNYALLVEAVVVLFIAFGLASAFGEIPAGYRGVVTQFSATTGEVKQPGLYIVIPFVQSVHPMSVQIQAYSVEADAASHDLQNVSTKLTLNYAIDPETSHIVNLYNSLGDSYEENIIAPAVQEVSKAAISKYSAEELITQRARAKDTLDALLTSRLARYDIHVSTTSLTDFHFSDEFTKAIEAKVVAFQNYLQSQNTLKQKQVEAQQAIATARGEAEANRLKRLTLTPLFVQYIAATRWDGKLPSVMGGAVPFFNLGSLDSVQK